MGFGVCTPVPDSRTVSAPVGAEAADRARSVTRSLGARVRGRLPYPPSDSLRVADLRFQCKRSLWVRCADSVIGRDACATREVEEVRGWYGRWRALSGSYRTPSAADSLSLRPLVAHSAVPLLSLSERESYPIYPVIRDFPGCTIPLDRAAGGVLGRHAAYTACRQFSRPFA